MSNNFIGNSDFIKYYHDITLNIFFIGFHSSENLCTVRSSFCQVNLLFKLPCWQQAHKI